MYKSANIFKCTYLCYIHFVVAFYHTNFSKLFSLIPFAVAQGRFPTHRGGRVRDLSDARLGEWNQQRILREFFGCFFSGKFGTRNWGSWENLRKKIWGFQNDKGYFYGTLSLSEIFNNSFRRTYHIVFLRSKWVWGGSVPSFHLAVFEHGYSK